MAGKFVLLVGGGMERDRIVASPLMFLVSIYTIFLAIDPPTSTHV